MANVEKFAAPISNRNIVQPVKEQKSSEAEKVDFQNTQRVRESPQDSEILKQHNRYDENQRGPAAFMNLLTDPQVTIGFMKSVFAMMDIVSLLPMQSRAFTDEMEQLFSELNVYPEEIAEEMTNQEKASTSFKGELFDFLRGLLGNGNNKEMKNAVISLLKAVNSEKSSEDILFALSGSFNYLSQQLKPMKALSEKLAYISDRFISDEAEDEFSDIKKEALDVLYDIERSVLYSSRNEKLISLIRYNISRFNTNEEFMTDSVNHLLTMLKEEEKPVFLQLLYDHLAYYENRDPSSPLSKSRVMNTITDILKMQSDSEEIKALNSDSVEAIIHSILSSPSNFTPLLHFLIPVEYEDVAAFAEMWIDPDEEHKDSNGEIKSSVHMFIVFDVDNLGRMETELRVLNKDIYLSLYCPEEVTDYIRKLSGELKKCSDATDYRIVDVSVHKSEKTRSLVEVFDGLSVRRSGINVRI